MATTSLAKCQYCGINHARPCADGAASIDCPIGKARRDLALKLTGQMSDPTQPIEPAADDAINRAIVEIMAGQRLGQAAARPADEPEAPGAPIDLSTLVAVPPAFVTNTPRPGETEEQTAAQVIDRSPIETLLKASGQTKLDPAQDAPEKLPDTPTNPAYYSRFAIQPIEFIRRNNLTFWQGNAIKYICRADAKNGVEDIDKTINYLLKERAYLLGDEKWYLQELPLVNQK